MSELRHFDCANTALLAAGDTTTQRTVSITNGGPYPIVEPLTQMPVLMGHTLTFTLTGDLAFEQVLSNAAQINALYDHTVLTVVEVSHLAAGA